MEYKILKGFLRKAYPERNNINLNPKFHKTFFSTLGVRLRAR